MNDKTAIYPIGTQGKPWGEQEKAEWLAQQTKKRSYQEQVVAKIDALKDRFQVEQYGELNYQDATFPLFVIKTKNWDEEKPAVLVTGGVHGYETSGVQGALLFAEEQMQEYSDDFNIVVFPCLSPWGYETINRWNPDTVDPNRSFIQDSPAQECALVMSYLDQLGVDFLAHIDLHETTDTDNSEFRPAKAAREGEVNTNWNIPDGFYLVGNSENLQQEFQIAVLEEVSEVTHIADADEEDKLIGAPVDLHGLISFPVNQLGLCISLTNAMYTTTTEVYPDSPKATPEECNRAQVAAVVGALKFLQ
ncbi:M14 family metallopeptidase [Idiomarina seosinensis]|uniref:Peptidase n=1 Tax=Idiomarina seosinensis TaxID=281739 RepID=A0A432ZKT1_9GAMM|nr:M14 family metallocarboxypeptidase [Idiomarina seosinensis]RUO77832.1 peptidase [Idiomarina seosinensis]